MEEASGKHSSDKSPPLLLMPISRVRSQAFLSVTDAWPEEPMSKVEEETLSGNALGSVNHLQYSSATNGITWSSDTATLWATALLMMHLT